MFIYFKVNQKCNFSPGKYTKKYGASIDMKRRKKYQRAMTKEGKRRRRQRKELKFSKEASCEIREGPTYATNIALEVMWCILLYAYITLITPDNTT